VATASEGPGDVRSALYLFRLDVPEPTGVQRYAVELAGAMAATAEEDRRVELWAGKSRSTSAAVSMHGLRPRQPAVNRQLLHLSWTLLHNPPFEVVAGSYDVVHLLAPTVVLPAKAPRVVTIHDLLPWEHPEWYTRGPVWRFRRSVLHASRSGAQIIVPSSFVMRRVRQILDVPEERIHVIHEGVSGRFAVPVAPELSVRLHKSLGLTPARYVMALGQLTERKNLAVAAAALRRMDTSVPLVIVGGAGPGAEKVRESVTRAGGRLVRFLGHRSDTEVAILLQHAAALVFPSISEGFGLPPLEAMAAGTPVIAADATSLPEVLGDAGLLAHPDDEAEWADCLERVLEDPATADELRRRGKRRASELTWDRAAQATWDVHRRAISQACGAPP